MRLHNGDIIIFFGDSITRASFGSSFIHALQRMLDDSGIKERFKFINAGQNGDMVRDLYFRADRDVLSRKPNWVVLLVGINDVLYESVYSYNAIMAQAEGFAAFQAMAERFRSDYARLVDMLKGGVENIAVCTLTGVEGETNLDLIERLAVANDAIRAIAEEKNCFLVEVSDAFRSKVGELREAGRREEYLLTIDGVHLGHSGAKVVAKALFDFFTEN